MLTQTCTSADHQEKYNIVFTMCILYICIQMSKYHKNGKPKNEISELEGCSFDLRGMILASHIDRQNAAKTEN